MSAPAARAGIWLADLAAVSDARLAGYLAWLGDDELARHGRFVRVERRRQFVAGRALLRLALGRLLDADPGAVLLDAQPGRAPRLLAPAVAVPGISVSHSGRWVACAVSLDAAVGLDIEVRDAGRDLLALAEQAFDAVTCTWLAALPDTTRVDAFYAAWSGHEARIKLGVPAACCIEVPHAELAMVLCGALPLAPPTVEAVNL